MPRFSFRLAAVLLSAAACADRHPTAPPLPGPAQAPPAATMLHCSVVVRTGTLACDAVRADARSSTRAAILGGQGTNVRLTSSGTSYDAGSEILRSDVTVTNLTSQSLGTTDGFTPSPEGVRVFFVSGPTVTVGTGTVTVENADGTGVFTSTEQVYFQYGGILFPDATTAAREWRFSAPATAEVFIFSVLVAAVVPNESGWVDLVPMAPSLQVGDTMRMAYSVRDFTGRALPGAPVTWATSNPAVATVDSGGLVTAVGAGSAAITATNGARSGRVTVEVTAASAAPSPTIVSVEIAPNTVTANGSDTVWVLARATSPLGVASMTFVLNGPDTNQLQCFGDRISGTALNGQYRCGLVVPSGAKGGVWTLTNVIASGNSTYRDLYASAIIAAGGQPFVNVRSPNEDVAAPTVTGFTFAPDTVRAGVDTVVVEVSFTEAGVGAAQADVIFRSEESGESFGCGTNGLAAGTRQAGTFRCPLPLQANARRGTWTVWYVSVRDLNGNVRTLYTADLQSAGFPTKLTVTDPGSP